MSLNIWDSPGKLKRGTLGFILDIVLTILIIAIVIVSISVIKPLELVDKDEESSVDSVLTDKTIYDDINNDSFVYATKRYRLPLPEECLSVIVNESMVDSDMMIAILYIESNFRADVIREGKHDTYFGISQIGKRMLEDELNVFVDDKDLLNPTINTHFFVNYINNRILEHRYIRNVLEEYHSMRETGITFDEYISRINDYIYMTKGKSICDIYPDFYKRKETIVYGGAVYYGK